MYDMSPPLIHAICHSHANLTIKFLCDGACSTSDYNFMILTGSLLPKHILEVIARLKPIMPVAAKTT